VPGQVEKKLGPVNILVNNAGIVVLGGVLELSPGDWDRVFETNLNAMVTPIKEMPLYDDVIKRTPGWPVWHARRMRRNPDLPGLARLRFCNRCYYLLGWRVRGAAMTFDYGAAIPASDLVH
jgi:NAD(P)-dependent dehydrogenase (short-subunit alcohol dehydrogenase family)